ncbi:outer membrane beta-barrel protein [uncultured Parabacteroides sp.]|uniref:outer membrane beta-barrel protein n=1 Tax=uncultured Parabacteroides sp. TaxID=512312 RepID=UPI00261B2F9A|nr:outer membrane beta-barrel protein [uncultured Parabacteroides sp.]
MKKLIVMLMLTLFSIGAYAQTQQGQSSFGFNLGYNFNDVGNATLGIDYRYCVTDAFRLTPSITHLVKNDGLSAWAIDMNAHYVFKLSEMFGFYPLAGLSLSFWKAGPWDATRFGANIGLGGEVYATDRVSVGLEAKYNIIKDLDAAALAVRVGYNF